MTIPCWPRPWRATNRPAEKQRLFHGVLNTAPAPGRTPGKPSSSVRRTPQGTNRRAVVTNRPGAHVLPAACYDEYAERGESENRNKELKTGLQADRLSDHRYFANLFRLYLHTAAYNLLVRMRQVVVDPPPAPSSEEVPTEALAGRERRRWHNRRREHDPLGEAQPCTWRTRLIKVAARVRETTRRVHVELSSSWPYLKHFQQASRRVLTAPRAAIDTS